MVHSRMKGVVSIEGGERRGGREVWGVNEGKRRKMRS